VGLAISLLKTPTERTKGLDMRPLPEDNYTRSIVQISREWIKKEGYRVLDEYKALLSIPNVATDLKNIKRNAELLVKMFGERGFDMKLLEIEGAPPIVYGEHKVSNATRTLCFYAHYDGQPVDPDHWFHEPFEPVLYDGILGQGGRPIKYPDEGEPIDEEWRIYARGASDDKAPIIALAAAVDALRNSDTGYTSNIKLFFDGEEEMSSPHVEQYFANFAALFEDITVWLLFDGAVYPTGDPSFTFGSRGVTGMQLTVYGATRPLHSGHYGNWAPVPGQMLSRLLASMKDDDGTVLIDGFYDTVAPVSAFEREQISQAPGIDAQLKEELGLATTEGDGEKLAERILLPSLTIRGLSSGSVGEKVRNIIPSQAIAELGIRLVKGNDPAQMMDLIEAHIRKQGWEIIYSDPDDKTHKRYSKLIKVVRDRDGFPAAKTCMDQPEIMEIVKGLKAFTNDRGVFLPGSGGSNRIKGVIFNRLKKPGIGITMVNRDNNQHAANENVRIGNIWLGVDMMAVLLALPE
jgi:acetylornithine deacetylase/succinyl-diaminopimelate desuccinylase-like protein